LDDPHSTAMVFPSFSPRVNESKALVDDCERPPPLHRRGRGAKRANPRDSPQSQTAGLAGRTGGAWVARATARVGWGGPWPQCVAVLVSKVMGTPRSWWCCGSSPAPNQKNPCQP